MKNEKFTVDYSGSGIKTLRVLGVILYIVSGIAIIPLFFAISGGAKFDEIAIVIGVSVGCLFSGAVFSALSVIAENALYQKTKLLREQHMIDD